MVHIDGIVVGWCVHMVSVLIGSHPNPAFKAIQDQFWSAGFKVHALLFFGGIGFRSWLWRLLIIHLCNIWCRRKFLISFNQNALSEVYQIQHKVLCIKIECSTLTMTVYGLLSNVCYVKKRFNLTKHMLAIKETIMYSYFYRLFYEVIFLQACVILLTRGLSSQDAMGQADPPAPHSDVRWSTSRLCASYWNAYLLNIWLKLKYR